MDRVDICIPTLKKREEIKDCLDAIEKHIPYGKIIFSNAIGFANARNELMKKVSTEYFLFIDDDIIVNRVWFNKLYNIMEKNLNVGAVNGFGLSDSFILNCLRHILMLRTILFQRGFTSNTLIRTEAIKNIKLETEGRLEDMELQQKIKKNGWRWKFCITYCKHKKDSRLVWKEALGDFNRIRKKEGLLKAILEI